MLILTEKPSVAAAFAAALNVPRADGYWMNDEFCIVNALGHLLEDFMPEDYDPALKKWTLDSLPVIPGTVQLKPVERTQDQLAVVTKCFAARRTDTLLLATDAEREGEVIGAEILDYAGFSGHASARRFWVSQALTPDVINEGIKNAKPLADYASYREQGFARRQADWLTGINLTRLMSLKSGKLLHFGRVQTALLGALYEREQSIRRFSPAIYHEVTAVLGDTRTFSVKLVNVDNEEFPFRFPQQSPALADIEAAQDSMTSGIITNMNTEQKTVQPPQLFNLTALQKEAHNKYAYAPEHTLAIAQALYEKHKCMSYPRTPSRVMGDENVALVSGIFSQLQSAYAQSGLAAVTSGADPARIATTNKRLFNSAELQDHHALIPLAPLPDGCSIEEKNIYTLVFQQFFTVLKPPYVYNAVHIDADISGRLFRGNGIAVLEAGWKTGMEPDEDGETPELYAGLEQHTAYPVVSISSAHKQTEPKKHFTFASMLQLMENPRSEEDGKRLTGLGTPATRGAIIQKLVDRNYITLKGKSLLLSDDGSFLIENILKNEALAAFISIPETTRWEEQLHENSGAFIAGIKDFVRGVVASTTVDVYRREKETVGTCPLCGGDVYEGKKSFYCANYKGTPPCALTIWKEICGAAVSAADARALLAGKLTKVKKCTGKTGKDFHAAFALAAGKIEFRFQDKKK